MRLPEHGKDRWRGSNPNAQNWLCPVFILTLHGVGYRIGRTPFIGLPLKPPERDAFPDLCRSEAGGIAGPVRRKRKGSRDDSRAKTVG